MNNMDSMMDTGLSYLPILKLVVYLIFIGLSWWGLQEFRFDVFMRRPKSLQSKVLQVLLSIALGYMVGNFFLDYIINSIHFGFS
ncbi:DUF1146 domain-containing protein [Paenibacillus albiflavus]|uniref:DUF1146 domain-containing protein n=1 Tax=Paenibacillus albiflavus TaxID=2545760 RepID=A0A4R4EAA0_9BACL|nr:DUF1146 family protein [Paenibacillus albiflavus]TCZ76806.1 DUF1146 domain-containing protein [Paenibacillus albiflavus]